MKSPKIFNILFGNRGLYIWIVASTNLFVQFLEFQFVKSIFFKTHLNLCHGFWRLCIRHNRSHSLFEISRQENVVASFAFTGFAECYKKNIGYTHKLLNRGIITCRSYSVYRNILRV